MHSFWSLALRANLVRRGFHFLISEVMAAKASFCFFLKQIVTCKLAEEVLPVFDERSNGSQGLLYSPIFFSLSVLRGIQFLMRKVMQRMPPLFFVNAKFSKVSAKYISHVMPL